LCAPIAKKGSIELTTRQIIMLILMIIIAAIIIVLGITYSDQAKTFLGNLMNSADKLV
jgi:hypothetical protein